MQKASKETIKAMNRQHIINFFFGKDKVSKSEVVEYTRLSPATVGNLIASLVVEGVLLQREYGASSGGRRPLFYSLNTGLHHILTVKITTKQVVAAVIDLAGSILASQTQLASIHDTASFTESVTTIITRLRQQEPVLMERVDTVAFSIPGVMDYTHARLVYSAALYVENYDLRFLVDTVLMGGLTVRVFKDTDALLLGEYHCGTSDCGSLAYFLCENGVGLSLMNRDKLFWADNCGMEIGHTVIDLKGKRCKCGLTGCVSTLLGENRAIERYIQLTSERTGQGTFDTTGLGYGKLQELSQAHDGCASQVMAEQLEILATALVNVVNLFNPREVVLGGPLAKCPQVEALLDRMVHDRVLKPFSQNLIVRCSTLDAQACLYGMAYECMKNGYFKTVGI
ncbi:MAG: ROK family protein [Sphaerochaetaceae bacterium]